MHLVSFTFDLSSLLGIMNKEINSNLSGESISLCHHFTQFPKIKHIVPKGDERDPQEKAKSSSKFSHQGCERVDQLLCPDYRFC